ncbi:MAG: beta-galactosidase [Ktedonobacteraceae bacterium]|nr:beta-galactosidase [Ktedonobacteraceae bacterium]
MTVTLTPTGLSVAQQEIPVYSGAVHYWRLERSLWPTILDQVQALGFSMIETYIPWSVHEITPGHYDWGQQDERKDFEAFLLLCEERGLWLIVRPGPLINAELTNFGFPSWVLGDPRIQARTAQNSPHLDAAWGLHPPRPFPVPSYASETFYQEVGRWFDVVTPLITRHLAPRGCIVSVQSDNETCYLFHDQAYATDYSDASLCLYRSFLQERYHDLSTLNATYHGHYTSFAEIDPPRDCQVQTRDDLPWHLDWIAYKEYQIRWCVARIARMLRERGIQDVPIFHDVAFQYRTPLDLARMEADPDIDWVGMNLYRNKESYRGAIQSIRFLAGSTRLPFVPEFGCGIWSHRDLTPTPDEQAFITISAFMYGVKAVNFYMLVERERWQGSPITRHGTLRPDYAPFYQQWAAFLKRYPLWRFERCRQALVLLNYDLGRYASLASTLHYAHADLYGLPRELFQVDLDLGLRWNALAEADERIWDNWFGTAIHALQRRFIDYDLADTHIDPERLQHYSFVFLPTTDFLDTTDQHNLLRYVQAGGHLVIGPGMPYLDPTLQPSEVLCTYLKAPGTTSIGQGTLTWVAQSDLEQLASNLLPPATYRSAHPAIDITTHHYAGQTLLFLANPTAQTISTSIHFTGQHGFHCVWGDPRTLSVQDSLPVELSPYSIQIWEVSA